MTLGTLVLRNLLRAKLRTGLLLLTITVAFFVYGFLTAIERAYDARTPTNDRLIVISSSGYTTQLPIALGARIRELEGVKQVGFASFFGGFLREPRNAVGVFAVEPELWLDQHPELIVSAAAREAFLRDRQGILIGEPLATRYGWKAGDRIVLGSLIYPRAGKNPSWEFNVSGVFRRGVATAPANYGFFRHDYFDESRPHSKGRVGWYVVTPQSSASLDDVAAAIDASFANSPAETTTTTEDAFLSAFNSQFGDLRLTVLAVMSAAFAAILLIVGNTMLIAIRERFRELAVMMAMGFARRRVLAVVTAECALLSVGGAVLGLLASVAGVALFRYLLPDLLPGELSLSASTIGSIMLIAASLALLTGALPAIQVTRLSVIQALGR